MVNFVGGNMAHVNDSFKVKYILCLTARMSYSSSRNEFQRLIISYKSIR